MWMSSCAFLTLTTSTDRYVLRVRRPAEGDCHFLHFPHSSPLPGRGVPDRELLVFTTCSEDGVAGGVGAEAVHAS